MTMPTSPKISSLDTISEKHSSPSGKDSLEKCETASVASIGPDERTGSSMGAYFNIICVIAGTGTLHLPFALHQTGWIGIALIVLSAVMAIYTGNILIRSLYVFPGRRLHGYADVGEAAFGMPGRWVVLFFNYAILLGAGCIYIMLAGTNTSELLMGTYVGQLLSKRAWIAIAGVLTLLPVVILKTLKEAAILSVFGTLATVVTVVVAAALSGIELGKPDRPEVHHMFANASQLAVALASISFSFGGNVVYPHVESSMRHPGSWSRVLTAAIMTICGIYFVICIPGYLAFGDTVQTPIFKSLPAGIPTMVAIIFITVHVLLAAPLLVTSFSLDVERSFGVDEKKIGRVKAFCFRAAIRTTTVTVITIVAMIVPFFGDFMSLLGAFANCMIVFVLPVACYLRLFGWRSVSKPMLVWCAIIVVIGMLCCVLGAIDAIKALHKDFTEEGVQF